MPQLPVLVNILLFTFFSTIISLLLVAVLLLHKSLIKSLSFSLVSFGAGALLATAFLDTLKEAVELGNDSIYLWITLSIAGFFIFERLFHFLHHHDDDTADELRLPTGFLLFGDGLHNFIDGTSIAASFLVSWQLGVVTSLAVFIHEIPHELGDFGILIHKGWGRASVLWFNIATGLMSLLGALLAYNLSKSFEHIVPILLAITTGNFIYLAATNLLPEIHHKAQKTFGFKDISFFLAGILMIALLINLLGH